MTKTQFLDVLYKDITNVFGSDSKVTNTIAVGKAKNETTEQLILRALKIRKGTSKVLKFLSAHKFTVDIDFSVINKDGLDDNAVKEDSAKRPRKLPEKTKASENIVKALDSKSKKGSMKKPADNIIQGKDEKIEEVIVDQDEQVESEQEVVEVNLQFSEINMQVIIDKVKYKFIEQISEEFKNDSIMKKAISSGRGKGETDDEIIIRILKARKDSKRTFLIAKAIGIQLGKYDNLPFRVKIERNSDITDPEILSLIENLKSLNQEKVEAGKESVYNHASNSAIIITSNSLLEILNRIENDFKNDSMIQKALLSGRGQNLSDADIIIKCFKTRSTSPKMISIAKEYSLKLYSETKDSIMNLVKASNINQKINIIFTDKWYSDKFNSVKKEGKTLNELALEKTQNNEKKEFSESKDISELKKQVFGNIIADMFDKDALPYISEQLNDIFKNDTVVKKSFLTSEKNNEGLVGKILRAKKIRPSSANLKILLEKIICDTDSIDDFKFNNVEYMKSEKAAEAAYSNLEESSFKYQITASSITIYDPSGEVYNASTSHPEFINIKESLLAEDFKNALMLINKTRQVTEHLKTVNDSMVVGGKNKKIEIIQKQLFITDTITNEKTLLNGALAGFIVDLSVAHAGEEIGNGKLKFESTSKFLMKMIENDMDEGSMDGLFKFLKAARVPINTDGNLLTYKRINSNYKDCHTGKIDNSIGQVVSMERSKVTYDPTTTCAAGLHVCSYGYLGHFSGAKLVICEVEPHDVVSVPNDYHFAKMRCCRYTVKEEITTSGDILASRPDCIYLN